MDTSIMFNGMPLSRHIAATILVDVLDVKETGEKYYSLEDKVTDKIESILKDVPVCPEDYWKTYIDDYIEMLSEDEEFMEGVQELTDEQRASLCEECYTRLINNDYMFDCIDSEVQNAVILMWKSKYGRK